MKPFCEQFVFVYLDLHKWNYVQWSVLLVHWLLQICLAWGRCLLVYALLHERSTQPPHFQRVLSLMLMILMFIFFPVHNVLWANQLSSLCVMCYGFKMSYVDIGSFCKLTSSASLWRFNLNIVFRYRL